jgi:putative acetyltransferase
MPATTQPTTIQVRRTEPADYAAVHRIFSMPKVVWGTLQVPFPSAETWRKRFAEPPEGSFQLVACVDDEVVGHISLHTFPNHPRRRHVGQIGMAVHGDWQGKGVGTALMQAVVDLADKWLNLSRLELTVFIDNEPAIRLYKRFGFTIEGTFVRFAFRDGQYVDTYAMARLRAE